MTPEQHKQVLDALKLAAPYYTHNKSFNDAIAIMEAEPQEHEAVAWRVHPYDYGIGYEGVYALTIRKEQVTIWQNNGWKVEPLALTEAELSALHDKLGGRPVVATYNESKRKA